MKKLEEYVKSIPDFPEKGIIFRDVTSVLQDADGLHMAIDQMQEKLEGETYSKTYPEEYRFLYQSFYSTQKYKDWHPSYAARSHSEKPHMQNKTHFFFSAAPSDR